MADTDVDKTIRPKLRLVTKTIRKRGNSIVLFGIGLIKTKYMNDAPLSDYSMYVGSRHYNVTFMPLLRKKIRGNRIVRFSLAIPTEQVLTGDIQNRLRLVLKDQYVGPVLFDIRDGRKGHLRRSRPLFVDGKTVFLRQLSGNVSNLTVRETDIFDSFGGRLRLAIGFIKSKMMPSREYVILYEKECDQYEESASILFEKLIDHGYENAFFILNKDHPKFDRIDAKYRNNLVPRYSLQHIALFLKADTFIGTETIAHAIQLRPINKLLLKKISSKDIKYVFLQHGVMYMVSLNSRLRSGFRKKKIRLHKVVASSRLEAEHFTSMAGFGEDDIYVCGLPKFDRAVRYDDADKIIIMPTWRRWEVNEASVDFKQTGYYRLIHSIYESIPEQLQKKTIVLPHPLMIDAIRADKTIDLTIPEGNVSYDEILKECRLLITDYSSISFDAFYRGSNVIFYWKDKDECMTHYGEDAYLMLNDDNAFGDVCYRQVDLKEVIERNYFEQQNSEKIGKYRQIVEFHDNKNTDRLIDYLKRDQVIQ